MSPHPQRSRGSELYPDRSARQRVLHRISDGVHEEVFNARVSAVRRDARRRLDLEHMPSILEATDSEFVGPKGP